MVLDGEIAQLSRGIASRRRWVHDKRRDENHGADDPAERGQNTGLSSGYGPPPHLTDLLLH
jgi:hypothetical protein